MPKITRNENGRRIGECHPRATLSDELVREIRRRNEELGHGPRKIARELQVGYSTVQKICSYARRGQVARSTVFVASPDERALRRYV